MLSEFSNSKIKKLYNNNVTAIVLLETATESLIGKYTSR